VNKPVLITDWDCTLAEPADRSFYAKHRAQTKKAIASTYKLSEQDVEHIASILGKENTRLEKMFSSQEVAARFNVSASNVGNYSELETELNAIDPKGWFQHDPELVKALRELKPYMNIIILSNSPEHLIKNIGTEIGFDMNNDFTGYYTMSAEGGPPKFVNAQNAFQTIIKEQKPNIPQSWSIGDSVKIDLDPASRIGFNTGFVDNIEKTNRETHPYTYRSTIIPMLQRIRRQFI
jgi:FMN phosphatase YigB (HAD superfamily)